MIQIHYQSKSNRQWIQWIQLGEGYDNIHEAINALNTFPFNFNAETSITSIYCGNDKNYSINLNIKFFDTKLNDYVPIESPWKIGLHLLNKPI